MTRSKRLRTAALTLAVLCFGSPAAPAQVRQAWLAEHDSILGGFECARDLALDRDGNAIVTGDAGATSPAILTLSYDRDGALRWAAESPLGASPRVVVDRLGASRVVWRTEPYSRSRTCEVVTLAYGREGDLLWEASFDTGEEGESLGGWGALHAVVDEAGTAWIAASGVCGDGSGRCALIARYDRDGRALETIRYDLPGPTDEVPAGIALDTGGNLILAGASWDGETSSPFLAKYDPSGALVWDRQSPVAGPVATDGDGDAYVVGRSADGARVAAFDASGGALWELPIPEPEGEERYWQRILVGPSGSIHMAGVRSAQDRRHPLLARCSGRGDGLWVASPEGLDGYPVLVTGLAADAAGATFVAGYTHDGWDVRSFLTAHDASGGELWRRVPEGGSTGFTALAMDPEGRLRVAGCRSYDLLTAAYDPSGGELWASTHDRAESCLDRPEALAVDSAGNVYLTGTRDRPDEPEQVTVKWSPAGEELWARSFGEACRGGTLSIAVHPDDTVSVAFEVFGGPLRDSRWRVVRHDPSGTVSWAVERDEAVDWRSEAPLAIAADGPRLVVSGTAGGSIVTVSYDGAGREEWAARREGPDPQEEARPEAIAVDRSGSVVVLGTSRGGTEVLRYARDGGLAWAKVIGEGTSLVALDSAGRPVLAGSNGSSGGFVAKLDLDGNELWRLLPPPGPSFLGLTRLAIDAADDVYLGGYTKGEPALDVLTMKVDPSGRVAWAAAYDLVGGTEVPGAIRPDGRGGVLVAIDACRGPGSTNGGGEALQVLEYDPSGDLAWVRGEAPRGGWEQVVGIALGPSGAAHVGVAVRNPGTAEDFLVLTLEADLPPFLRGDCDGDGRASLTDAVFLLAHAFLGGPEPGCAAACDADGDREMSGISDAIFLLQGLFLGGPEPPRPSGACGGGDFADLDLGCGRAPPGCGG